MNERSFIMIWQYALRWGRLGSVALATVFFGGTVPLKLGFSAVAKATDPWWARLGSVALATVFFVENDLRLSNST